jgi:hypothetical protein
LFRPPQVLVFRGRFVCRLGEVSPPGRIVGEIGSPATLDERLLGARRLGLGGL